MFLASDLSEAFRCATAGFGTSCFGFCIGFLLAIIQLHQRFSIGVPPDFIEGLIGAGVEGIGFGVGLFSAMLILLSFLSQLRILAEIP